MLPEQGGFGARVKRQEACQVARSLQAIHPPRVGDKVALIGDAFSSTLSEIHGDSAVITAPTRDEEVQRGRDRTVPLVNVFRARDLITAAVEVGLPPRNQRLGHPFKK